MQAGEMQAQEARRRSHQHEKPSSYRGTLRSYPSPLGLGPFESDSDGLQPSGEKRKKRVKERPPSPLAWVVLCLLGMVVFWMTWRLGTSIFAFLPRLQDEVRHQAAPIIGSSERPPCRLQDGNIIPAQEPCSIQACYACPKPPKLSHREAYRLPIVSSTSPSTCLCPFLSMFLPSARLIDAMAYHGCQ